MVGEILQLPANYYKIFDEVLIICVVVFVARRHQNFKKKSFYALSHFAFLFCLTRYWIGDATCVCDDNVKFKINVVNESRYKYYVVSSSFT